jgi:predicted RNA-binding Zn ribbon-like protein
MLTVAAPPADLCLSFTNTRHWRGTEQASDEFADLEGLADWCTASAGLDAGLADRFRALNLQAPERGHAMFTGAITLREALFRLFRAVFDAAPPARSDLDILNAALAEVPARSGLMMEGGRFLWQVDAGELGLSLLLAPVLWSAGDLLSGPALARVRCCANEKCLWLFHDDSKAGTRRWCSMSSCGNRAKAHRHYQKSKQA